MPQVPRMNGRRVMININGSIAESFKRDDVSFTDNKHIKKYYMTAINSNLL